MVLVSPAALLIVGGLAIVIIVGIVALVVWFATRAS